ELAALQLGAAVVMPNPRWKESEHGSALDLTSPAFVVAAEETAGLLEALARGRAESGEGPAADKTVPALLLVDGERPGWISLDTTAEAERAPLPELDRESESILPFSSGTTGLPKAVRHSRRSLAAATDLWTRVSGIREGDRLQIFTPLFHIYGASTVGAAFAT